MVFPNPILFHILTLDLLHSVKYDFDIPSTRDLRHSPLVVTLVTISHLHLGLVNPSFSDMIPIPPERTSTSDSQHTYIIIFVVSRASVAQLVRARDC